MPFLINLLEKIVLINALVRHLLCVDWGRDGAETPGELECRCHLEGEALTHDCSE